MAGSKMEYKPLEEQHSGSIPDPAICLQQGDRICYNDIGNKEIVKKIHAEDASTRSQESIELDSIRSGESLFKTFTFDIRQDSDRDMKKCLAFWKTILEKNVKPVKCSFLNKTDDDKTKKEKPQPSVCDSEEMLKKWTEIYKDLQRRKLDKIKLIRKQKCEPCEDYIDEEYEKKQEKEDIKKLNEWTSQKEKLKSETLKNLDVNAQIKRTLKNLQSDKEEDKKSDRMSARKNSSKRSSRVSIVLTPTQQKSQTSKSGSSSLKETPSSTTSKELLQTIEEPPEIPEPEIPAEPQISAEPEIPSELKINTLPVAESEENEEIEAACGVPCACARPCTCQPRADNADTCTCGCATADCVCREIQKLCMCGCLEDECICEHDEECLCGCGLDECICRDLFPGSCKCGHEDCECDLIEIMSAYMETLPLVPKEQLQQSKTVQTLEEARDWRVEVSKRTEGAKYCVICGHYDCFCNLKKIE